MTGLEVTGKQIQAKQREECSRNSMEFLESELFGTRHIKTPAAGPLDRGSADGTPELQTSLWRRIWRLKVRWTRAGKDTQLVLSVILVHE
jgi:hypothetical protein